MGVVNASSLKNKYRVLWLALCYFSLANGQLEEANFHDSSSADFKETYMLIEAVTGSSLFIEAVTRWQGNLTDAGGLSSRSLAAEPLFSNDFSTSFTNATTESISLEANKNFLSPIISQKTDKENKYVEANHLRTSVLGDCITDTLFVVDSTSSVAKIFNQEKEYIAKVVELLNISSQGNHISLLIYSGKLRHRITYTFGPDQTKLMALKKVQGLPFLGGVTSTGVALDHASMEITNKRRSNDTAVNVVVVTDGFSYDPVDVQSQNLRQLPKVRTFSVAVGDMKSQSELLIMAGRPENLFNGPNSYIELVEQLTVCEPKPVLSPSFNKNGAQLPQNDASQNSVGVADKISSAQLPIQINPSSISKESGNILDNYLQSAMDSSREKEQKQADCPVDVVFVFDASGSLQERFGKQLEMATTLFEVLPPLPTSGHISVIKFSGRGRSRVILPLSNALSKKEIKEVILDMPFFGGTTFTNEGLEKAVAQLSNSSTAGHRKQVVIVFTDGFSYEDPSPAAKTLHDMGVNVLAVAFNNQFPVNRQELDILTWQKKEHVFMDSNYRELKQKLRQLTHC